MSVTSAPALPSEVTEVNVFHKFTRRSLAKSRSRTLVTIIGIMLSMAMFTAVLEAVYSGLQYLVRAETASAGAFHGLYRSLDDDEAKKIAGFDGVKDSAVWRRVGWAEIDTDNEYKPYIILQSAGDRITDFVSVKLASGRMPENSSEIILPDNLKAAGYKFDVGDVITLSVGERTLDGEVLGENESFYPDTGETIENPAEKTYTVVGSYFRLDYTIESYNCPGFTAITTGERSGDITLFFTVKHPTSFFGITEKIEKSGITAKCVSHSDLLMYSGVFRDGGLTAVLYGFIAVLIFLIAFGSVSLIYNSFSISVGERTKQFGLLKSVGATRKQIRGSVLYEAVCLCAVAVPAGMIVGCAGIGVTLWLLRDAFTFLPGAGDSITMRLVITPAGLLAAAAICVVTTLISAWIPARRAIKITPIDAIRQTDDVKLRGKDVRGGRLSGRLFGFEGMLAAKNFGRNRKRCRSTVFSLFLSVALFISASSFCSYLTDMIGGVTAANGDTQADIEYYMFQEEGDEKPERVFDVLSGAKGVTDGLYYRYVSCDMVVRADDLTDMMIDNIYVVGKETDESKKAYSINTLITFIDDDSFRDFCRGNELDSKLFFDNSAPLAVVCNNLNKMYSTSEEPRRWLSLDILKNPAAIAYAMKERSIEGYVQGETSVGENGEILYYYYPDEYFYELQGKGGNNELDRSKALVKTAAEVEERINITVGALVNGIPMGVSGSDMMTLVYPLSMRDSVLNTPLFAERGDGTARFCFKSEDHSATYTAMSTVLAENGMSNNHLIDHVESYESERRMTMVINVFSYGFIVLISLIAMANVFNTVSTNIALRRREFAMLKSVGMTRRGFSKMMNYECMIYGVKGIMWGLPAALVMTYIIYLITDMMYTKAFYIPWYSVVISVGSVFIVVFATMLYSMRKIRGDNPIDALKNENL